VERFPVLVRIIGNGRDVVNGAGEGVWGGRVERTGFRGNIAKAVAERTRRKKVPDTFRGPFLHTRHSSLANSRLFGETPYYFPWTAGLGGNLHLPVGPAWRGGHVATVLQMVGASQFSRHGPQRVSQCDN
jgi:hypothetical protein